MKSIQKILSINFNRNKIMLLMAVFGTVFLCFIFEMMKPAAEFYGVTNIPIGVIDYDNSVLSKNLNSYLAENLKMDVHDGNYNELSDKLLNRDISAIIEIPDGFYNSSLLNNPEKLIITTLDDYENNAFIKAYLDTYMQSVSLLSQAANGDNASLENMLGSIQSGKISVESAIKTDRKSESELQGFSQAVGFMCMLMLMLCIFISNMIIDDKKLGTFNRMRISNVKPIEYITGVALFGIIICVIFVSGLYGYLIFNNAHIGMPYWFAVSATFLIILFFVGFTVLAALLTESKITTLSIITGYSSIACIIGGAYFPIDESVGWIKNLSYLTPHYWFMDIMKNYNETNIITNIIVLALFTLFVYLASAVVFAKKSA